MALANEAKKLLKKKLARKRLFYVARDAERAEAGLTDSTINNFYIITNPSDRAKELKKLYPHQIIIVPGKTPKNTLELLRDKKIKKLFRSDDWVIVFKPTELIERECAKIGINLINPPAKLASQIEEKISQVSWLGNLTQFLPKTKIDIVKNIKWQNKKFILQFNRAHTGSGTILVESAKQLKEIENLFPNREARVCQYIKGPIITSNNTVTKNKILVGNISYQITGLYPFTGNTFSTIGNDWAWPVKQMSARQKKYYEQIAVQIGKRLRQSGWKGLFGIDAVIEEKTGKIYLIEINARQPASTSFESYLQNQSKNIGVNTFFTHLFALLNIDCQLPIIEIRDGAQIIQRVTEETKILPAPLCFKPVAWKYSIYNNSKIGEDLMRIQTTKGIIASHNELNEHGNEISIFVSIAKQRRVFNLPRAGMIITRQNKILLIKRHRYNYDYWVVPGGTLEKNETPLDAAKREILEETGLICEPNQKIKPIIIDGTKDEIYYFTNTESNSVKLGGPEKETNSPANNYQLKWVSFKDVQKINLLPPALKNELVKRLKTIK